MNVTKVVVTSVLSHTHLLVPGRSSSMSATQPRLCALATWNDVAVSTCAVIGTLHIFTRTTPFWDAFTVEWYASYFYDVPNPTSLTGTAARRLR